MEVALQPFVLQLDCLPDEFREIQEGVRKAVQIAHIDPEMGLTRCRKTLEWMIRDIYYRRYNEPPGTRPLENLIARLTKDDHLPDRIKAYATGTRELGNVGTHSFGEQLTAQDVSRSLAQLGQVVVWYFETEHPDAMPASWDAALRSVLAAPVQNLGGTDNDASVASKLGRSVTTRQFAAALGVVLFGAITAQAIVWLLISLFIEMPLLSRAAVGSLPLGCCILLLRREAIRKMERAGQARCQEALEELKRALRERLDEPQLLTPASVRSLASGIEKRHRSPIITDLLIIETIRAVALDLELEDRLRGTVLLQQLQLLNGLLIGIDASVPPLLSLALVDRLNAYVRSLRFETRLSLAVFFFLVGLVFLLGFAIFSFQLILVLAYWACLCCCFFGALDTTMDVYRAAEYWGTHDEAFSGPHILRWLFPGALNRPPPGRVIAAMSREEWADRYWHLDGAPIWEMGLISFKSAKTFEMMHQFRYDHAVELWRRLRCLQREYDHSRLSLLPVRETYNHEFASLCRELWVVTGEARFRVIERRGELIGEDLRYGIIKNL